MFVLLGFLCIQISDYSAAGQATFFSTVAMIAFWFSGILLLLYLFHVIYVFHKIPWTKIEFYFCVGATLFLMLASALIAAKGIGLFTAAAVSIAIIKILQLWWIVKMILSYLWTCFSSTVFRICGNVRIWIRCFLEVQTVQHSHHKRCHQNHHRDCRIDHLILQSSAHVQTAHIHTKKLRKFCD